MDNNNSQSFANLWSSASLFRAAMAVSRPSEHYCTSDMAQKAVPAKADLFTLGSVPVVVMVSILIEPSIGSENCALSLCA